MKLRIKASVKATAHKEELEQSRYHMLEKQGDNYILQWGSDKPELWVPSTGMKSFQIIIEGMDYEYGGLVDHPGWNQARPSWVLETEELEPTLAGVKKARLKLKSNEDLEWGPNDKIEAYGVKGMKSTPWRIKSSRIKKPSTSGWKKKMGIQKSRVCVDT